MELDKYIGIDVHSSTLVVNARDAFGKVILESTVATNAEAIIQCIGGLRGRLHVTFEEGTMRSGCTRCCDGVWMTSWCAMRERVVCCRTAATPTRSMLGRCHIYCG